MKFHQTRIQPKCMLNESPALSGIGMNHLHPKQRFWEYQM